MESKTQTGALTMGTGTTHDPLQLLFIDWLSFMASMPDRSYLDTVPPGYRVVLHDKETLMFHELYTVSTAAGRPLLTLQAHPRVIYNTADTVSVKLDNALLYSSDWYDVLIQFLIDFHIENPSITRVDFAVDSQEIPYGIPTSEFAQRLADGDFVKSGKYNIVVHKTQGRYISPSSVNMADKWGTDANPIPAENVANGMPVLNCVTLGTHSSLAQFQCYNKSLELAEHLCVNGEYRKQYIFDLWKSAGLDVSKSVWRTEIRLNSKADVLEYKGVDGVIRTKKLTISDLDPVRNLKSTILQAFNRWAQIFSFIGRDGTKRAHITRESRVRFLSETSQLSFGAHCSQSRSMSKYVRGVLNFVTDLFDECKRRGLSKPADGVVQGWTIRFFLEKLYEFCSRTEENAIYETGAPMHLPVSNLRAISQRYIDGLMSTYTDLRHVLTSGEQVPVVFMDGTSEVEFTQEDMEWLYHFQSNSL